ncbi:superoxide dismutase [Cu-Zn]-like isoform X2 [Pogonomyrmex barbatus]|uniref:superoxide dismutase n=1 Tax=Pogonomyrmex barbatus TaxID=144034 RepID=A0A8N1S1X3_9HYME|nr:superoxide dismutase [Cu-Zn]-like isoform X2 [Pogonomyrmex barbatus]
MWRLSIVISMIAIARAGPYDRTTDAVNDRTLFIRSLPGYPGTRSDLYEAVGLKAVVELKALDENGMPVDGPRGMLTLEQQPEGVRVTGTITGLQPGLHGFHVHEKGDLRKGCNSAGPHFNPYMVNHGAPSDPLRHVGDLGNIQVGQEGVANIDGIDHYLSLVGVRGAIGRTLVVHAKPDDLGRGGTEESLKTGSAGERIACGVIGFL